MFFLHDFDRSDLYRTSQNDQSIKWIGMESFLDSDQILDKNFQNFQFRKMTGRDHLTRIRIKTHSGISMDPWLGFFEKFCCFEISIEDSYETFSKQIPKTTLGGYHKNHSVQKDRNFSIVEVNFGRFPDKSELDGRFTIF